MKKKTKKIKTNQLSLIDKFRIYRAEINSVYEGGIMTPFYGQTVKSTAKYWGKKWANLKIDRILKKNPNDLEILMGDDAFLDPFVEKMFQETYIPLIKKGLPEYNVRVQMKTTPISVMITADYADVVVTDLDYTGGGKGKEGYEVIENVKKLIPKPLIILCTSSDNYEEINKRTKGKIDYHAGTGNGHKFDDLVEILINHYRQ